MSKTHVPRFRIPARGDAFAAALEGLTRVNVGIMSEGGVDGAGLPPLYEAGVRYRNEPKDVWRNALDVAREKWGDCEDLSAYRAAELRVSGEDPDASVALYKSGPYRYHAIVQRGDGTVEDPSKVLGMKGGSPMRGIKRNARCNVIGGDPTPDREMSFEIMKIPGGFGKPTGYRGYVRIPLGVQLPDGTAAAQFTVGPEKSSPAKAIEAAAATAESSTAPKGNNTIKKLLDNPEVTKALSTVPGGKEIAAVLSDPGAQEAIAKGAGELKNAAKKVGSTIKSGLSKLKFW